jgi:hypothetical protein
MKLVLASFCLAVAIGYLLGGRISWLGRLNVRWPLLALVGLALQLVPAPGDTLPVVLLWLSFVSLCAFAIANVRTTGFALILIGIVLNFTVIAVNDGMPVTRHALVASRQTDSLEALVGSGGAKHHLATEEDRLVFLGDVIPIAPIHQAVSIGDLFTYLGVVLLIVVGMLGPKARVDRPASEVPRAAG